MLLELRVENLLLIERAELRLGPGLNVVTGETGAGKTVLAHALDLLLGGKPRSGVVRPGAGEAYVEGVFALPPGLLDGLDELRERLPEGEEEIVLAPPRGRRGADAGVRPGPIRTRRRPPPRWAAGWSPSTASTSTASSPCPRRSSGRSTPSAGRSTSSCSIASRPRTDALRRHGGSSRSCATGRARGIATATCSRSRSRRSRRSTRVPRTRVRSRRSATGSHASTASARPPGRRPRRWRRRRATGRGVAAGLAEADRLADAVAGADPELDTLAQRMRGLRIEAEDLGAELRRYEEGLEAEPGRLEEVAARLDLYERLKRKHGGTVEAVVAHAERCRAERERLEGMEVALGELEAELAAAATEESKLAVRLSKARRGAAPDLASRVLAELGALAMEDAAFEVVLEEREELGPAGAERVELMISPNPGVPPAPLRETASGGELSRAMLALMSVANAGGERDPRVRRGSTRGSVGRRPGPSASASGGSPRAGRWCASPTCRRSPHWPSATSASRRRRAATWLAPRSSGSTRRRSSRSCAGCSARTPPTRGQEGTPKNLLAAA